MPDLDSTNNDAATTLENSVNGDGIGDIAMTARHQLLGGRARTHDVIASPQGVISTGADPFAIPHDEPGQAHSGTPGKKTC